MGFILSVYVDKPRWPYKGMIMGHMLADTASELHQMARRIGLKRHWFQPRSTPHYDINETSHQLALASGAILSDRKMIVSMIRKIRADPGSFYDH